MRCAEVPRLTHADVARVSRFLGSTTVIETYDIQDGTESRTEYGMKNTGRLADPALRPGQPNALAAFAPFAPSALRQARSGAADRR